MQISGCSKQGRSAGEGGSQCVEERGRIAKLG